MGPTHQNADLALPGSPHQTTRNRAGLRDYPVYTGTCESLESDGIVAVRGGGGRQIRRWQRDRNGRRKNENSLDRTRDNGVSLSRC